MRACAQPIETVSQEGAYSFVLHGIMSPGPRLNGFLSFRESPVNSRGVLGATYPRHSDNMGRIPRNVSGYG